MKQKTKRLLSWVFTLVMLVGLVPWISLTARADQVVQAGYNYNANMTLNTISAEFYNDNSVKSITAEYSWGWGDVAGQSLVLVDKMIPKEGGNDYSVTYPYFDGNLYNRESSNEVDTFEESQQRVSNVVPGIQFVANSVMQGAYDGTNSRVLQFSEGQLPSDGNNTYYLFLWTDRGSSDPGVYPDYHLATVIVSGGQLYIGEKETVPTVPTYTVTLTGGDNATPSGGNTTQSALKGKMTDVVYTANEGYYFPTDYNVASVNGISVTRNDFTKITVSGTPTANTEIALTAPRAKTGQEAPTGLSATKASSSTATDGKISGVTSAMEYQIDGASTWTAVGENKTEITGLTAGTYKVRYAGTADKNASPATTVEVGVKGAATVTKATTAKSLIYTGSAQELVTAGVADGGTMQYALGTATEATQPYTTSIPTATNAGTYYVWYGVKGDLNHNDSAPDCVTVYITNSFYTVTSVENREHTIDYPNDIIITVKRNVADDITFSMYTGASVDGNGIPADGSSVAQGSLILTLKGSYLDTLSTGTHKVTISFKDGSADATISIVNAPPAPTAAPTHVPKTGDGANLGLWIGLILLGFLGIIAFTGLVGRKHRNR